MKLDIKNFEEKISSPWMKYLLPFFESEKAYNIYQELKNLSKAGEKITPKSSDTWRFLKETDPDNIKMIIIGLDSYPGQYDKNTFHATGIPFDCSNSPNGKLQPSLISLYEGIGADVQDELPQEKDLSYLLKQGVFLGNRGIVTKLFKAESLLTLFDYFWEIFFQEYVNKRPDVPVVLLGKGAEYLKRWVTFNPLFILRHPSFAVRTGQIWDTEKVFTKVNKLIEGNNGSDFKIEWNYNKWKEKQIIKPKEISEYSEDELAAIECPF